MKENSIEFDILLEIIEQYKKENKNTIEIKITLLESLIDMIKEYKEAISITVIQKLNLVNALKGLGVKDEIIQNVLNVVESKKETESKKENE